MITCRCGQQARTNIRSTACSADDIPRSGVLQTGHYSFLVSGLCDLKREPYVRSRKDLRRRSFLQVFVRALYLRSTGRELRNCVPTASRSEEGYRMETPEHYILCYNQTTPQEKKISSLFTKIFLQICKKCLQTAVSSCIVINAVT